MLWRSVNTESIIHTIHDHGYNTCMQESMDCMVYCLFEESKSKSQNKRRARISEIFITINDFLSVSIHLLNSCIDLNERTAMPANVLLNKALREKCDSQCVSSPEIT